MLLCLESRLDCNFLMEKYEMEDSKFCGNVPEFGAIFMANNETRKVCFKRNIFGLPFTQANFVKQIQKGMPLFLFEYEKRQLFGVYRASSDGAMKIMPHFFSSTGKQFPAQVRFTPIWVCHPLSESEFKSAISENYYSPKKFNFGLSEEQVWRLLQLFSTRVLYSMLPSRRLIKDSHRSPTQRVRGDLSSSANGLEEDRRISSERTHVYRSCDHLLESRAEIRGHYLDNERIPPNSESFSRGGNVLRSPDSEEVALNFTRESLDLRKRAQHFNSKDRNVAEDGRSLTDSIMRSQHDLDPFLVDRRHGGVTVNRNDTVLMSENVLGLNHKDNYIRLGSLSENFRTPIDGEQRRNKEQRFSYVDNQIKTSYIDYLNRSTTLNLPSQNDTCLESFNRQSSAINELDTRNVTRAGDISSKYNALNHSSSERLNTPFPNVYFSDYDSTFGDDIVTSVPDRPNQSASNPYLSRSNYRAFSKGLNSERMSLRTASDAEYRGVEFSPVRFGSSPLNEKYAIDLNPYGVYPKYISCQMPEEIFTWCPRGANLTDPADMRNLEYDAVNDELASYNNNNNDDDYSLHMKQRKSVFTRLNSSIRIPDQEKDTDIYSYSPVDEVMEILRQDEKLIVKKLKRKTATIEQLGDEEEEEEEEIEKKIDIVFVPREEANNKAVDGGVVHETLTETRAVEFRRRRDNADESKIQIDKQAKRRKLIRPVFAVNLNDDKPTSPL